MHSLTPTPRAAGLHLPPRSVRAPPRAVRADASPSGRRALLLSLMGGAAGLTGVARDAVAATEAPPKRGSSSGSEPFLSRSGARGVLAEEERRLFQLRMQKEGEVIQVRVWMDGGESAFFFVF